MKLGPHWRLLLGGQGNTFGLLDITHTGPWAAVCHVLTAGGLDGEQKGMAVDQGNRSKTTRPNCRLLLIFSSAADAEHGVGQTYLWEGAATPAAVGVLTAAGLLRTL